MANQETKKNTKKNTTASAAGKQKQSSSSPNKQNTSDQCDRSVEKKDCPFMKMYKKHPNTVALTLIALIVALCFIILGFWETILIILLTGVGFMYGQYKDKELWVYHLLKRLLK